LAPRRLLILRHAKAAVASSGNGDIDRPLAERGHEQMAIMGPAIVEAGFAPEHILCSSALRTRETLEDLVPALPALVPVTLSRGVYDADAGDLLSLIAGTDPAVGSLMVIGHNPTLHELAVGLAGHGDGELLKNLRAKFPTAALAAIAFDAADWASVKPGEGRLLALLTPRGMED
jgi:phosphohistidine phosphatase